MAKKIYVGVNDKARNVTKIYVGVSGVARKVKKAYVGVAGVARLFFESVPSVGWNKIFPEKKISISFDLTSVTSGNYAYFAGGRKNSTSSGYITMCSTYNSSLTRSNATALTVARSDLASTSVGNYALFGGGKTTNNNKTNSTNAYNSSRTQSTPTALSVARSDLAATTIGSYGLFSGGAINNATYSTCTDAYNTSLTMSTPEGLHTGEAYFAATTIGNYALFGGGIASYAVETYNTSLTHSYSNCPALTYEAFGVSAVSTNNYALFSGGSYGTKVTAYNSSLTRSYADPLSVGRENQYATVIGNYALFGGGETSSSNNSRTQTSVVESYDLSLTKSALPDLSTSRGHGAAATVSNYAIFAGGQSNFTGSNEVEAYYKTT